MGRVVVLLCGPPACGKTELANSLQTQYEQCISISFDEFFTIDEQKVAVEIENGIKSLRHKFLAAAKDIFDHKMNTDVVRNSFEHRTALRWDVMIVEDNFYRRSMRYKWFQEIKKREMSFCTVCFTTPLEICRQRNQRRHSPVPDTVIVEQFSKLELPDSDKNAWEKFSLVSQSPSVEDVVVMIFAARKSPFTLCELEQHRSEKSQRSREQTKRSRTHQTELAFRKAVFELISEAPQVNKCKLYAQLSGFKWDIIGSEIITTCPQAEVHYKIVALLRQRMSSL